MKPAFENNSDMNGEFYEYVNKNFVKLVKSYKDKVKDGYITAFHGAASFRVSMEEDFLKVSKEKKAEDKLKRERESEKGTKPKEKKVKSPKVKKEKPVKEKHEPEAPKTETRTPEPETKKESGGSSDLDKLLAMYE
jgi:hypothetical protein